MDISTVMTIITNESLGSSPTSDSIIIIIIIIIIKAICLWTAMTPCKDQ